MSNFGFLGITLSLHFFIAVLLTFKNLSDTNKLTYSLTSSWKKEDYSSLSYHKT